MNVWVSNIQDKCHKLFNRVWGTFILSFAGNVEKWKIEIYAFNFYFSKCFNVVDHFNIDYLNVGERERD